MKRPFIALCIWLLLPVSACPAVTTFEIYEASALSQAIKRNKLIVGMEVGFFPFEYADTDGRPVGFDVELANIAASELGVALEIKEIEFSGLIPALQIGKIDMIISGMSRTPARARTVCFTQPYFEAGLCALVSNKRAPQVFEVASLNAEGRILAVKLGTTGDIVTGRLFPKATVKRFKEETECVLEVVSGRADAFIYDQVSVNRHHAQNLQTTHAIEKPFTFEPYAVAIKSGDFDFLNWLNILLETIKADGRYEQLRKKYFGDLP
ncbi:MAG TPA: transporter substrate-binding domain-containing protein [Syntrophobacteraceae bacterium]|nr:transporter substrate-binding domain-containing protein [Syntrophobacteraceae bacterium]